MLFRTQGRKSKKIIENYHRQQLTEGLFQKCEACNQIVYTEDVIEKSMFAQTVDIIFEWHRWNVLEWY